MYDDEDLNAAVSAGVMPAEIAAAFRRFMAERHQTATPDDERFRLVSGFNDVFVTIAIGLVLISVSQLSGSEDSMVAGLLIAGLSWVLAEYFSKRRRMALPSLVLLLTFCLGLSMASLTVVDPFAAHNPPAATAKAVAIALAVAGGTYLHWRRFKIPAAIAGIALFVLAAVYSLVTLVLGAAVLEHWTWVMLAGGIAIFALAMHWDASDRTRQTRRSDVAFWLHMAAAPMIAHPLFSLLGLLNANPSKAWEAGAAVTLYVAMTLVAIAIDRRAMLVSALAYVLGALIALLQAGSSGGEAFAIIGLVVGAALLLLSSLWQRARRKVLALLPPSWQAKLPPAE
ncbi:hypothetical protein [Magnetospirillum moscoviense]|uniref:DUF2157 domain-containing protein n=1 Tax=Magnetospirillum moscoviense TaxID=1437059 RepID=A0A178N0Z5_9PROT|nr:hypothetical protein [Magnetospirillum moscoviense]OAN59546.1 hypothetical protein A6A05_07340 [Magnetospirillum moscoviense]